MVLHLHQQHFKCLIGTKCRPRTFLSLQEVLFVCGAREWSSSVQTHSSLTVRIAPMSFLSLPPLLYSSYSQMGNNLNYLRLMLAIARNLIPRTKYARRDWFPGREGSCGMHLWVGGYEGGKRPSHCRAATSQQGYGCWPSGWPRPLHLKKGQTVGIVKVSSVSTWSVVVPQSFASVFLRTRPFTNVPLSRQTAV